MAERVEAWRRVLRRSEFANSGCIEFLGFRMKSGHGQVRNPDGSQYAHVVLYEAVYGPVDDGFVVHHRCENPPCVNPIHLTLLSRADHGREHSLNAAKTHCKLGHEFTPENTYVPPSHPAERWCRACLREKSRQQAARRKAERNGVLT